MNVVTRLIAIFMLVPISYLCNGQLLKVGVAGLSHDHVHSILQQYKKGEVVILGIAEADQQLVERHKKNYALPDSIFFTSLEALLKKHKPDIVLAYNAIADHLGVVELCAPEKIPVMVEKPLATTVKDAERIAALAKQHGIQVLTNYETTWYASNHAAYAITNQQQGIGAVRKMIVHSGHEGPKKIGCSPDFLQWLTDPVKNGGGALIDFGCYGANLMTWMMKGAMPLSVMALTKNIQPALYPKVDDEATIVLEYPGATGIIEASWNWPYGIKDMQVYGVTGFLHAVNGNSLLKHGANGNEPVPLQPAPYRDNLVYLAKVLRGEIDPSNDLSSLENNMTVVRILDAARRSAKEGRRISLK